MFFSELFVSLSLKSPQGERIIKYHVTHTTLSRMSKIIISQVDKDSLKESKACTLLKMYFSILKANLLFTSLLFYIGLQATYGIFSLSFKNKD